MTEESREAKEAKAASARSPMWKRSSEAWNTIADEWPLGGGDAVDVRRQALLGIFTFLGLPMDEQDMNRMQTAGSEDINEAMARIERLLR
jgi:hypothetical protein